MICFSFSMDYSFNIVCAFKVKGCEFFVKSCNKSHIIEWGLATLSFDWYKIVQSLQGRSCTLCFKTVLGMKKVTPTPSPRPFPPLSPKN